MNEQTIDSQTRLYLYDLMNAAKEHGFKADDTWEFGMVTDTERSRIQRNYYPTIATKVPPEAMLQVFHSVKGKLNQAFSEDEQLIDKRTIEKGDLSYLVAYNLKRPRT